jgi:hypothetical protein
MAGKDLSAELFGSTNGRDLSAELFAPIEQPTKDSTFMQDVGQAARDIASGAYRGAGSIGATILSPFDYAAQKMGIQNSWIGRNDRREAIDAQFKEAGANPESIAYGGGKLAGEIAGTAGIGGGLAKGFQFAPKFASALQAGGFAKDAGLGTNIAAGALTSGAASGLTGGNIGIGSAIGGALPVGVKAVKSIVPAVLGMTTGAGGESIRKAFSAGKKGGETAKAFTENMRGSVAPEEVLNLARADIAEMGAKKAADYRKGMAAVSGDKTVLSFNGIDKAMKNAYDMATYKGVVKNVTAAKKLQEVYDAIGKWKQLNPAEYHTPEGMDALKQNVGGLLESIPFEEKTARNAVGNIYNSIKGEISKQAPTYSKVMKDYSSATETISEIEKALSLGKKASVDTSMRKLQSLMRNNVNTNFGNRLNLAKTMEQAGGREILPSIAGQALNTITPRGLQSATTLPTAYLGYGAGGLPLAVGGLLAGSPRLVGEAAYGAGKLSNLANQRALDAARLAAIIRGSQME